jgi:hypothetical protein
MSAWQDDGESADMQSMDGFEKAAAATRRVLRDSLDSFRLPVREHNPLVPGEPDTGLESPPVVIDDSRVKVRDMPQVEPETVERLLVGRSFRLLLRFQIKSMRCLDGDFRARRTDEIASGSPTQKPPSTTSKLDPALLRELF